MTKTLKTKWLAALRSGKYKQGRCALKEDGKFCCLGVLNDIAGARQNYKFADERAKVCLVDGDYRAAQKAEDILIDLNDRKKFTFKRIAVWVENNL